MDFDGKKFCWLDIEDLSLIFNKKADQIKVKAIFFKYKNASISIDKKKENAEVFTEAGLMDEPTINLSDENLSSFKDISYIDEENSEDESESDDVDEEFDKQADADKDDEDDLQLPLKLPIFSSLIEKHLQNGTVWNLKKLRCQMIRELCVFYTAEKDFCDLKSSKQYKAIGLTILNNYKALRKQINEICDSENKIRMISNSQSLKKKIDSAMGLFIFNCFITFNNHHYKIIFHLEIHF